VHSMVIQKPLLKALAALRRKIRASTLASFLPLREMILARLMKSTSRALKVLGRSPAQTKMGCLCAVAASLLADMGGSLIMARVLRALESPMSSKIRPAKLNRRGAGMEFGGAFVA